MRDDILTMDHISKSFGGVHALRDVSFHVRKGEIHVLAGENGAGKSTLLKMLVGIHQPDAGTITFRGEEVRIKNPQDAQDMGIGMVFQELTLINELTVLENVYLDMEYKKHGLIDTKRMKAEIKSLMEQYHINICPEDIVARLSVAQKQMVEILKLLVKAPELLILDEPTSSLARKEVEQLYDIIRTMVKNGKTVIFISHRMEEVFELGDWITVYKDGKYVADRDMKDLTEDELIRLQVGRTLEHIFPEKSRNLEHKEAVFEVRNLCAGKLLQDISFEVYKGEVLGIAGLQGHGQTELLNALSGIGKVGHGEILVNGKRVRNTNSSKAVKNGIALVPDDRKTEGLMLELPIAQNLTVASLDRRQRMGFIRKKEEADFIKTTIKNLTIKVSSVKLPVNSLSGGNQQKVVLGKELGIGPEVLLFNEPTRGIDVEAKSDFYHIIRELANEGVAVVVNSSDMMEVMGVCDRIAVMYEGRIQTFLEPEEFSEENIMRWAMGIGGDADDDKHKEYHE